MLRVVVFGSLPTCARRPIARETVRFRTPSISAVQELAGRRVVAFMSDNHIDPDLAVEVFILKPAGTVGRFEPSRVPS
jgi:hypothetical protein